MYEFQLELSSQAQGKRPAISADETLDFHLRLAQLIDFSSLAKRKA